MEQLIKLNLGCGKNIKQGYVNVDKYGDPDVIHDLELFPWPWASNSVGEIVLNHVLEHLGQMSEMFMEIMKELYRVSAPGAKIHITVPHPRSDDFMNDPTHVRIITPELISLFSKKKNTEWVSGGYANSPLALYHNVDMEVESTNYMLEEPWGGQYNNKEISLEEIEFAVKRYNNIIKEVYMVVKVIK